LTDYNQAAADKLMDRIITSPESPDAGRLTNDLLTQFHRGFPLENIRRLLSSPNQDLVGIAVWIASELGPKGKPILGDIAPLLAHPSKRIRFFAVDCVLTWAGPPNAVELGSTIKLLNDPEQAVRWKVMQFLSRATKDQLQSGLSYLEIMEPQSRTVAGLRWLLSSSSTNPDVVMAALQAQDDLMRKYGAVAAVRISTTKSEPLRYAASLADPDVKDFADSSIAGGTS